MTLLDKIKERLQCDDRTAKAVRLVMLGAETEQTAATYLGIPLADFDALLVKYHDAILEGRDDAKALEVLRSVKPEPEFTDDELAEAEATAMHEPGRDRHGITEANAHVAPEPPEKPEDYYCDRCGLNHTGDCPPDDIIDLAHEDPPPGVGR